MDKAFVGFCRGGLEGYAAGLTDKPWLLDKSRGWGIHYPFLDAFIPTPKSFAWFVIRWIFLFHGAHLRKAKLRNPDWSNRKKC